MLTVDATAALVGHTCWLEARCFEVLGAWVPLIAEPEVKLLVARHGRHHGWHVELLGEVLPATRDHDPGQLVVPVGDGWPAAIRYVAGDAGTTTLERLAGLYQALLPRLVVTHVETLDATSPVSDGPLARRLRLVVEDERADLAEGLAALEARPDPGAADLAAARRAAVEAALPPR